MKSKLTIIGICIFLVLTLAACSLVQADDENVELTNEEKNIVEYEFTEDGIIKPEIAEEIIKDTAEKVINTLHEKDMKSLANFVHPNKGLRFTPYTYVALENDLVFTKDGIGNFLENKKEYLWGHYDGSGFEIKLTPALYYEKFIYSEEFINAEEIGYNTVLSTGNMLENQFEVYENPIIVEYYFPGFDPQYQGIDWKSLRLVFEEHEKTWFLVGIIHNQWTI